jgi:hypothetical protein
MYKEEAELTQLQKHHFCKSKDENKLPFKCTEHYSKYVRDLANGKQN